MKLQVLVSTVNANVVELIKKMNINSDAIIINQCDINAYEEISNRGHLIKVYSFKERGIGLSRNNALMRATADIVLFADDDEVLANNYEKIIINEFKKNDKADMLVFGIESFGGERKAEVIKRNRKLHKFNCLKYGAVRFAIKTDCVRKRNIYFSQLFGGGCKYGSGEDSIFIYDVIGKGLKAYTSSKIIASIDMSISSWFNGYTNKYFFDKGALFYTLYGKAAYFFMFLFLIRHKYENCELTFLERFKLMIDGYFSIKN